jgi:DNA mismatch endonuclease (patch repair protein)
MLAAKQRDTKPELELRSLLESAGLAIEVDIAPISNLRRRADILVRDVRLAIFVDGCFWHGCPTHGTWPRHNAEYWRKKIEANMQRDNDTNERFHEAGWYVLRVWEHENMQEIAERILEIVIQLKR